MRNHIKRDHIHTANIYIIATMLLVIISLLPGLDRSIDDMSPFLIPEKKKEEAIARREKEINVRIPLEILGNAGFVPLYKDIRKAVMKEIYSGLEKADKNASDK